MQVFSVIAIGVIAVLLVALIVLATLTMLAWSRTRNLAWRVQDLEDAVRRLQREASLPRLREDDQQRLPHDVGGGSTAIRE